MYATARQGVATAELVGAAVDCGLRYVVFSSTAAADGRLVVCHRVEVTHSIEIAYSCSCNRFPSSYPSFEIMMSEGVEDPMWTA